VLATGTVAVLAGNAPGAAVAWGALPVWYLSISAARYLFEFGCWLRERQERPVAAFPDTSVRRSLAGLQMVVVALALALPTSVGVVWPVATAAMVPSLVVFARDYPVATAGSASRKLIKRQTFTRRHERRS
jgi:CDP-diacylglycerol--glycerol-3-phosphate 3-phosphatidyltransferase